MGAHIRGRAADGFRIALGSLSVVAIAALAGAVLIALTGGNPIKTYGAILSGSGLQWFVPWLGAGERTSAAFGLQQTLIMFVPLVLLGVAVAIPLRAGLFNIGGTGQYLLGSFSAALVGSWFTGLPALIHLPLAVLAGVAAGAVWAAVAGVLRAYVGTNEVVVTIMLNYVAIWAGSYLFGLGGPFQNSAQPTQPVSEDVVRQARIPVIWGSSALQGLHAGIVVVPVVLFLMWLLYHRSTVGFETRAVGVNVEASRYLGIPVARRYAGAMVVGGVFAGLAGAMDVLGWQLRIVTSDLQGVQLGFVGIAVALLGRNSPVGIFFSAALFSVLLSGTSVRNLDPTVYPVELAGYLAMVGQGLIIVLVSLDAARANGFIARVRSRLMHRKVQA
ncbi:ABC transporter permease [Dactylosporangium sp. CA-233914]|uniref:ABC transporter permease n=1 Tax=Dactylosporangium sp. CA-233914 TaxID=3239934 RepID=UPI003D8F6095